MFSVQHCDNDIVILPVPCVQCPDATVIFPSGRRLSFFQPFTPSSASSSVILPMPHLHRGARPVILPMPCVHCRTFPCLPMPRVQCLMSTVVKNTVILPMPGLHVHEGHCLSSHALSPLLRIPMPSNVDCQRPDGTATLPMPCVQRCCHFSQWPVTFIFPKPYAQFREFQCHPSTPSCPLP